MSALLTEGFDLFLRDTLVWTGVLLGAVLLLRRPVARHFGARVAYALWAIPLIRLWVPPVTLPAWMNPAPAPEPALPIADPAMTMADPLVGLAAPEALASPVDMVAPLVVLWLAGALVFLVRRFWLYGQLRRELLAQAVPVGEVGAIRLIETPAISGPMAFGVLDKVIALPTGFMTRRERQVRDLAIAHELAHHRGHDLLVNIAMQPLFALHWFNPLGYLGWSALRRDQEAACDARVIALRGRGERAAYAAVIADFARAPQVAPRPALAAPMACPVLGDKSIIHRLRSLSMSEPSPRRRLTGRAAIACALLAVPLTASIAFASAEPDALDLPEFTPTAMPAAVMAQGDEALAAGDRELERAEREMASAQGETLQIERQVENDNGVVRETIRMNGKDWSELTAAEKARVRAELDEARVDLRRARDDAGAMAERKREAESRREWARERVAYAENRKQWAESRLEWAESRREWADARAEARAEANGAVAEAVAVAMHSVPEVVEKCIDPKQPVVTRQTIKGTSVIYTCESAGERIALDAVRSARGAIAADRSLSDSLRAEILRELDAEIRDLEAAI